MPRDYQTRKYIREKTAFYNDDRLTDVLVRTFDLICSNQEPDGCFSNSVALHVILKSMGYNPQFCYGLCVLPCGQEVYHAWLEVDGKVLDLSIYGNTRFSPYLPLNQEPLNPVVFEPYEETPVKYGNGILDEDWNNSLIAKGVAMGSIENYINNAPRNAMWKLIFEILDETYTAKRHGELKQFVSKEQL